MSELLILIILKTKMTNSKKKDCQIESSSLTNHNPCHMSLAQIMLLPGAFHSLQWGMLKICVGEDCSCHFTLWRGIRMKFKASVFIGICSVGIMEMRCFSGWVWQKVLVYQKFTKNHILYWPTLVLFNNLLTIKAGALWRKREFDNIIRNASCALPNL